MASSKKTGASAKKPAKSKAIESKNEDAKVVASKAAAGAGSDTVTGKADDARVSGMQKSDVQKVDAKKLQGKTSDPKKPDVLDNSKSPIKDTSATAETVADAKPADKPTTKPQPETAKDKMPEVARSTPTSTPESKSIFLPLVLGGIVAGALGFMASEYKVFGNADAEITSKLRSDLNTQQERIAALETAEPPAVEAPAVDLSPIETQLAVLEERIEALEERPVVLAPEGVDGEAAAAYAAELEALKVSAETQRAEIAALLDDAKTVEEATAEAARIARAQTAIAKIVSAIDSGQPYPDAMETLTALELGEIDPALATSAETGVATLSALQSEFPEKARMALATARAGGAAEGQQGLGNFLKRSLGARSVAPRDGNDPDAVLSRAEAKINAGDLAAALNELDTLPEEAQAAIADWREAADARVATRNAADALAQRLTAD